jgi:hypothetical protein
MCCKIVRDELGQGSFPGVMIHAAFNPNMSLTNWSCPTHPLLLTTVLGPSGSYAGPPAPDLQHIQFDSSNFRPVC